LQTTVDAAARAGCTGLQVSPAEVRIRAKAIAASNTVNGAPLTLLDSDIELGTWEPVGKTFALLSGAAESTANAVRVTGRLIAAGIEQAQSVFNVYPRTSANRSMVIVSDGEPQPLAGNKHPGLSAAQLLTLAQQDADTAYASGINVYVVFWDNANDATAA